MVCVGNPCASKGCRSIFLIKIEHLFEKMHFFLFFERLFENIAIPLRRVFGNRYR